MEGRVNRDNHPSIRPSTYLSIHPSISSACRSELRRRGGGLFNRCQEPPLSGKDVFVCVCVCVDRDLHAFTPEHYSTVHCILGTLSAALSQYHIIWEIARGEHVFWEGGGDCRNGEMTISPFS